MARALTLVPADSHEAGRLLSRYGQVLGVAESDYEGAEQALGQAIAIARSKGDIQLEAQALAYAASVSGHHLRSQECVDHGLRAIELGADDETPFSEMLPRLSIVSGLLCMGDLDAARPHALVLRDMVERGSTPRSFFAFSFSHIASLSFLEGDWKAVREYSDRGLEMSPVYLERLLEAMRRGGTGASLRVSMAITAIARITGVPDRLEIAEEAAEEVLSAQFVTPRDAMNAKIGLARPRASSRGAAPGRLLLGRTPPSHTPA